MTDRFKDALKTMPDKHAHRIWMWLANNFETIVEALTLATEAEQLRNERDELAVAVVNADYRGVDDKTLELAKRIIENGNA